MYIGYFTGAFLFKYSVILEDAILRHYIVTHVTTLCGSYVAEHAVMYKLCVDTSEAKLHNTTLANKDYCARIMVSVW